MVNFQSFGLQIFFNFPDTQNATKENGRSQYNLCAPLLFPGSVIFPRHVMPSGVLCKAISGLIPDFTFKSIEKVFLVTPKDSAANVFFLLPFKLCKFKPGKSISPIVSHVSRSARIFRRRFVCCGLIPEACPVSNSLFSPFPRRYALEIG